MGVGGVGVDVDGDFGDAHAGALALEDGDPGEDFELFERDLAVERVLLELLEFRFDDALDLPETERVELQQRELHAGDLVGPFLHRRRSLLAGELLGVRARPVPGLDVTDDRLV